MPETTKKLLISDLLDCKIVTAEGKLIGHVADVQITPGPEYRVTALLFGEGGWLYRLHVLNHLAHRTPHKPDSVPWEAVDTIKHPVITLKAGYPSDDK